MTESQEALFWLFGVPFWCVVSLLGRRAMRDRVEEGLVGQSEVDSFARGFVISLASFSLICAAGSYLGGEWGGRIVGLAGSVACFGFLAWLWRNDGAAQLVRFGPFINLPLKRETNVRIVATILALLLGLGNLAAALVPAGSA